MAKFSVNGTAEWPIGTVEWCTMAIQRIELLEKGMENAIEAIEKEDFPDAHATLENTLTSET